MKISVLITTYNLENCIDAAIESVLRQRMPCDWEILIGDDGSKDNTVNRINAWVSKYPDNIKLFCLQRDSGTGKIGSRAAKNRAFLLEKSSGDYINYLDGDDVMVGEDKFERQVTLLENENYADCSCCATNIEAYVIPKSKRYKMADEKLPLRKFTFEEYWSYYYFHTNTILFRKQCKELLLDKTYRDFLNDNFITFLLLQCGKLLYIPEVYSIYNITGEGLWTGNGKVYGNFRNMQLFDLENHIRPADKSLILRKHHADIRAIQSYYCMDDYDRVKPLVDGLDPSIFIYTCLLSKLEGLSKEEIKKKNKLFREANFSISKSRIHTLFVKLGIK